MFLTPDHHKTTIIIGGLLLIGLTLITGIAAYDETRQQIESSLGRGLAVALQGQRHLFESEIENGLLDTRALAMRPFLIQLIQQLNTQPGKNSALNDLERNVYSLTEIGFSAAVIFDKQGNKLSEIGRFSTNQNQALLLNKQGDTFLIWDDELILHTNKLVIDQDGQRIGSITTETPLPQLTRSFIEIREIGKTGEFILCALQKEKTQKIACLMSQTNGVTFKHLPNLTEDKVLPINYALERESGVIAVKDYRQIDVIEAYAPLHVNATDLGMVLKLDEEELFEPATRNLKIIFLYLTGLAFEIILLVWFVRRLIKFKRETWQLKAKTEQFSIKLNHKELELQSRLKKITCLYEIRNSLGQELTVDKVCQQVFKYLIPAMNFSNAVFVVIEINGKRFTSTKFNQSQMHELQSKINVNGKVCGKLSVFYPEGESISILEEQRFIDAIVSDLEGWFERRNLEHALVSIAEKQQHTIGQELHDNIGQQVAAIGYQVRALEKKISAFGNGDMVTLAVSIATQVQTAVIQIKRLAQGLLPFGLEANGLIAALQSLVLTISKTYNIKCEFIHNNALLTNDNHLTLNLYRIVQEAANNAIRHGGAKHLTISLVTEEEKLFLSICDDGCGFADNTERKNKVTQGMGIKIMQYRAKQLGAKLKFLSRVEGGKEVQLTIQRV